MLAFAVVENLFIDANSIHFDSSDFMEGRQVLRATAALNRIQAATSLDARIAVERLLTNDERNDNKILYVMENLARSTSRESSVISAARTIAIYRGLPGSEEQLLVMFELVTPDNSGRCRKDHDCASILSEWMLNDIVMRTLKSYADDKVALSGAISSIASAAYFYHTLGEVREKPSFLGLVETLGKEYGMDISKSLGPLNDGAIFTLYAPVEQYASISGDPGLVDRTLSGLAIYKGMPGILLDITTALERLGDMMGMIRGIDENARHTILASPTLYLQRATSDAVSGAVFEYSESETLARIIFPIMVGYANLGEETSFMASKQVRKGYMKRIISCFDDYGILEDQDNPVHRTITEFILKMIESEAQFADSRTVLLDMLDRHEGMPGVQMTLAMEYMYRVVDETNSDEQLAYMLKMMKHDYVERLLERAYIPNFAAQFMVGKRVMELAHQAAKGDITPENFRENVIYLLTLSLKGLSAEMKRYQMLSYVESLRGSPSMN